MKVRIRTPAMFGKPHFSWTMAQLRLPFLFHFRRGETRGGRLYYVVNTVREILQTKDIETLHRVNFPLTINLQVRLTRMATHTRLKGRF